MHYRNGREAKIGDRIVGRDASGSPFSGVVIGNYPGATKCNLQVAPVNIWVVASADEALHIDDFFSLTSTPTN